MVQKIGTRIGQKLEESWFQKFNGVVEKNEWVVVQKN